LSLCGQAVMERCQRIGSVSSAAIFHAGHLVIRDTFHADDADTILGDSRSRLATRIPAYEILF
jgi:hypothetical protein